MMPVSTHNTKTKKLDCLKKRSDFLCVQSKGRKWVAKGLIVIAMPRDAGDRTRYGVVATKKLSKLAVDRNRVKRRLRAIAQSILPEHAKTGVDYVLIGKKETLTRPYCELQKDLKWCLKRLDDSKDKVEKA